MSANERLVMVLVGGLLAGGTCFGLLASGDHPRPLPPAVIAALLTMGLLAFALWPRGGGR